MASGATRDQWRKTALAAMANYIDAGSIVAGAVSLPLWAKQFGFGDDFVSLLGAMNSECDLGGHRRADRRAHLRPVGAQEDLPVRPAAVRVRRVVDRVRAGAVDAAVRLLRRRPDGGRGRARVVDADHRDRAGEGARAAGRARAGALVRGRDRAAAARASRCSDLGEWMPRILFAQLFVVALITWALRQGMVESELWAKAQEQAEGAAGAFRELFRKHTRRAGVPDRHVRRLEPRRRHLRVLLPVHPRGGRQHVRPRELHAAGDLVPVHGARGRHALHAADRPRERPQDAAVGERSCRSPGSCRSSSSTSASSPR